MGVLLCLCVRPAHAAAELEPAKTTSPATGQVDSKYDRFLHQTGQTGPERPSGRAPETPECPDCMKYKDGTTCKTCRGTRKQPGVMVMDAGDPRANGWYVRKEFDTNDSEDEGILGGGQWENSD